MTINCPTAETLFALRRLWQQAFGDPDSFLDGFFEKGFSFERCRCLFEKEQLAAALYWFDCSCNGQKLAYIYAVATDEAYRHLGLCHTLMEDTLTCLKKSGYAGAVLVPAGERLRQLYCHMGFRNFGGIREILCTQGSGCARIQRISMEEYAALRRKLLPEGGVLQEGSALAFLDTYTEFYAGEKLLFTLYRDTDSAFCAELLGDISQAPAILRALGFLQGRFRAPGNDPFAMYYPLAESFSVPAYFGHALD